MAYSKKVIDHFDNPKNVGSLDKSDPNVGTGLVGAPACGDVMKLQIKVEDDKIVDAKFKTYGCGSAIASSSLLTEWVRGKTVEQAQEMGLLPEEFDKIKGILGRTPNFCELSVFGVMWSEHCSYKNSIKWLKTLPKKGPHMLVEAGEENAGLVDIGKLK